MKIGLIDVDGHNFPNLALMKISAYHKAQDNDVEWADCFGQYDIVYMSKVFTFTPDYQFPINSKQIIKGGTGYDIHSKLQTEIENCNPDYFLYPVNDWYDRMTAYGFLTRGCIRNCKWCIVPEKEGKIKPHWNIERVLQGKKKAILMDNNILACDYGIEQLEKIANIGCKVDFNQGLDARLVTNEIARILSKIKWLRYIRFAYDTKQQLNSLLEAIEKLNKHGVKNSKIFCYCLIQDLEDSYNRINKAKEIKINPFAQPYRDFTPNQIIPKWQKDMARWCNNKALLKSFDFMDYEPRKGFKCGQYFDSEYKGNSLIKRNVNQLKLEV